MVKSIWSVDSHLAAAIFLVLTFSSPPLTEGTQSTNSPNFTLTRNDSSAGQPADQDLRHFSIVSTPLLPSRPASQISAISITADVQDDFEQHQPEHAVLGSGDTRGDVDTIADEVTMAQGEVFISLDYSVLTPRYTFSSDSDLPFLSLSLDAGLAAKVLFASQTQGVYEEIPVTPKDDGEALQPSDESVGSQALQDIINRPMSAIQLGAALSPITAKGEALKTPDGISEHPSSRLIEIHYIAAPWTIARPPSFTFPIKYQPLYFEDPNLERCGASYGCLTEFSSIAHMGIRIQLLPYLMASNSPHACVRALPDCPTCCRFGIDAYIPQPTVKATAVDAAAIIGFIFLIP